MLHGTILCFLVLCGVLAEKRVVKFKVVNATSTLLIFFTFALSYKNGFDWPSYVNLLEHVANSKITDLFQLVTDYKMEPLFVLLSYIAVLFSTSLISLQVLVNVVSGFFYYMGLNNLKLNAGYFYALIYFVNLLRLQTSTFRQAIAVAVCFYAFSILTKGETKKFSGYVLVGSLFHHTALISFLVLPLYTLDRSNRLTYLCLLVVLFTTINFVGLAPLYTLSELLSLSGLLSTVLDKLEYYSESGTYIYFTVQKFMLLIFSLLLLIPQLKRNFHTAPNSLVFYALIIHLFVNFLLWGFPNVFTLRLEYYFQFGWVAIVIMLARKFSFASVRIGLAMIVLICTIKSSLFFRSFSNYLVYFKYNTIIETIQAKEFYRNRLDEAIFADETSEKTF